MAVINNDDFSRVAMEEYEKAAAPENVAATATLPGAPSNTALDEMNGIYDGWIAGVEKIGNEQIEMVKNWEKTQTDSQNAMTAFTLQQIEQQKDQAKKDYEKEQKAAYVDWKKQTNPYGVNAEQMATMGMGGTGYSESSMVAMWNQYQNRVAVGREAYLMAVQDYDNAMTQAQLQNNSALAEIAYKSLEQRLELSMNIVQDKNALLVEKTQQKLTAENMYAEVLQQIYDELGITGDEEPGAHVENTGDVFAMPYVQTEGDSAHQNLHEALEAVGTTGNAGNTGTTGGNEPAGGQGETEKQTSPDGEEFGYFANGYQPKGIIGHGELNFTDDYVKFETPTANGGTEIVRQRILIADDDTLWYWDDYQRKYMPFTLPEYQGGGAGGKKLAVKGNWER